MYSTVKYTDDKRFAEGKTGVEDKKRYGPVFTGSCAI